MMLITTLAEYSRMIGLSDTNESGVAYLGRFVRLWAQSQHPALSRYGYDVHDGTHCARIILHFDYNRLGGNIYPILSLENFPVVFSSPPFQFTRLSSPPIQSSYPILPALPSSPLYQPSHPVLRRKSNPPTLAYFHLNLPEYA